MLKARSVVQAVGQGVFIHSRPQQNVLCVHVFLQFYASCLDLLLLFDFALCQIQSMSSDP